MRRSIRVITSPEGGETDGRRFRSPGGTGAGPRGGPAVAGPQAPDDAPTDGSNNQTRTTGRRDEAAGASPRLNDADIGQPRRAGSTNRTAGDGPAVNRGGGRPPQLAKGLPGAGPAGGRPRNEGGRPPGGPRAAAWMPHPERGGWVGLANCARSHGWRRATFKLLATRPVVRMGQPRTFFRKRDTDHAPDLCAQRSGDVRLQDDARRRNQPVPPRTKKVRC